MRGNKQTLLGEILNKSHEANIDNHEADNIHTVYNTIYIICISALIANAANTETSNRSVQFEEPRKILLLITIVNVTRSSKDECSAVIKQSS